MSVRRKRREEDKSRDRVNGLCPVSVGKKKDKRGERGERETKRERCTEDNVKNKRRRVSKEVMAKEGK